MKSIRNFQVNYELLPEILMDLSMHFNNFLSLSDCLLITFLRSL